MRHPFLGLVGAAVLVVAGTAQATDYTLDPNHTQVRFSWTHFGFSEPEANFNQVTGTIHADDQDPTQSSVTVTIPVKSLDTHVALLDEHLLNKPGFFKPKQYPDITFKSTDIRNVSDDKQHFDLVGDLTVNGITHQQVLHATVNKVGAHPMYDGAKAAGFNATTTIKRSDYGMDAYVPVVSDQLQVRITAEAIESKAFAKKGE